MSKKNLSVYIKDHLAGSVVALRLFDRISRVSDDEELVRQLASVRDAVKRDQELLHELRRKLGVSKSPLRNLAAALVQLFSSLKLRLEGSKHGELQLLHALDSLSLGIEGKKALWSALAAGSEVNPRLRLTDYRELIRRADEQLATLHRVRAEAAQRAFSPGET